MSPSRDHERYIRLTREPDSRLSPNEIAWRQGYQAGWTNGRELGLQPGITDHVDPMRTLLLLESKLSAEQLQQYQALIDHMAHVIRTSEDDSTTWDAA